MNVLEKIKYLVEQGFNTDIEGDTLENTLFRKVLFTADNMQLVLMAINEGEAIGTEIHKKSDQFIRIEEGKGKATIGTRTFEIEDGDAFIIPRGTRHQVTNTGEGQLKLYAIYAPPHHPPNRIDKEKPVEAD